MTDQLAVAGISASEVQSVLNSGEVQIVDIRPSFDFAGGRIPGSVSLPNRSLATRGDQLDKNRKIVFVSEDGGQSASMAQMAHSLGFVDVANLEGGFDAWLDAGYPVHTIDDGS